MTRSVPLMPWHTAEPLHVRLEDGFSDYDGRIGICYDGEWGTVCDDGINDSAEVACRQLGFTTT